jgi:hypothetical protein
LARRLNSITLGDEEDNPVWKWTGSKKFYVKSIYMQLTKSDEGESSKIIWKSKIPEKVKIFMWLLAQKSILTKENMLKRNRQGSPDCYFCGGAETVDHLLFTCPSQR